MSDTGGTAARSTGSGPDEDSTPLEPAGSTDATTVPLFLWDRPGNAIALLIIGCASLAAGVLTLITFQFETSLVVGIALTAAGMAFVGAALWTFRSVRVWKTRLQGQGTAWEPTWWTHRIVRNVFLPVVKERALELASRALKGSYDRTQGVVRFYGVRIKDGEVLAHAGYALLAGLLPKTIRIVGQSTASGTNLRVTIRTYYWREEGEGIADNVLAAIRAQAGSDLG